MHISFIFYTLFISQPEYIACHAYKNNRLYYAKDPNIEFLVSHS